MNQLLLLASGLIFILLVITITLLQRSRLKYKSAKKALNHSHRMLEQRVIERTDKLRAINAKLYDEINRHGSTEILLRQTQDHLHSIINAMPSVMISINRAGKITHWNSSAEQSTDIPTAQALGRALNEVLPQLDLPGITIEQLMAAGEARLFENIQQGQGSHCQHADITVYPLHSGDSITGAVIRIDDVTRRVQLENMMIQNEKMMSLGELAAGMAHEINNPLSAVIQNSQNIQRRLSSGLETNRQLADQLNLPLPALEQYMEQRGILRFVDNIREAGERAAAIVGNMLEFSRFNNRSHAPTDLIDLINRCLELASSSFELEDGQFKHIEVVKHFPTTLPKVNCASSEIQQVLLNILRNAAQAVTTIESDPSRHARIDLTVSMDEHHVTVAVADNGDGMEESVRRHIFEPFFTTKAVGKGTGLGLSVSYFIITEHHSGTINVESRPGTGTRFVIKLPLLHRLSSPLTGTGTTNYWQTPQATP